MSFQDVGMRGSKRQPVNATMQQQTAATTAPAGSAGSAASASTPSSSAWGSLSIPAPTATTHISESLTQYQRNVGILEKIAQALLTNTTGTGTAGKAGAARVELEQQYKAQSDVLRELEQRLREQILGQRQRLSSVKETSSQRQALLKLERDFERVQSSVQATKAKVARQMKQYQQRGDYSHNNNNNNSNSNGDYGTTGAAGGGNHSANLLQQQQEQIQIQLQQDRLNEEIMREREDEIRKINKGMHQVNEIYKDLAHIVGEQQESVDQIEDKMEDARNTAQSGLDQVHQANEKYGTASQCTIS